MDTFVEQIIVKKKGPKEIAIITGTILLVVILVFVLAPSVDFLISKWQSAMEAICGRCVMQIT